MAAASPTTLPFAQLRPGHEASPPVNIRATDPASADVAALAANIADRIAAGQSPLIEPLVVVEGPKPRGGARLYFVCNGGRRLAALTRLVDQGIITEAQQLPVVVEGKAAGLEASTTAAVLAAPHHPVDQFEAFARIAATRPGGAEGNVEFIARRFGLGLRRVRQVLALGNLSPAVRKAWKEGRISRETAEAFAIEPDAEVQSTLLDNLSHRGFSISPYEVRRSLLADRISASSDKVGFVGLDTYLAAGGTLTGDLFTDERYIEHPALLQRLALERREAVERDFRDAGWGFIFWRNTPEAQNFWSSQQEPREAVWTPEAEARADVIRNEIAAIDAARQAREADAEDDDAEDDDAEIYEDEPEDDVADWREGDDEPAAPAADSLADQRAALHAELVSLRQAAECAGWTREERAGLAVILDWRQGSLTVDAGYVPPALATHEADTAEGVPEDDREGDDTPQPPAEPEAPGLPRAALQSLSLVANRAAAATIAADADLALSLLAASWVARANALHTPGNSVPLIVASRGLHDGPASDMLTELVAGDGGRPDRWDKTRRIADFAGLASAIADMSRPRRLELVAALAAAAVDLTHDTIENRSGSAKNVDAGGVASFLATLPAQAFETNARLILSAPGEAEAIFGDWPKEALVDAIRAMDGDEAAKQAARAKKAALVTMVADRARGTGWLPKGLRLASPAQAEGAASSQPDGDAMDDGDADDEQEAA
jgi:ParB family chromosome partitioning protein